jgi:hypothetical protein
MPSHASTDRPAPQPPERGAVDALISRTRELRGDMDAVRRDALVDEDDPHGRWQRALCDLAVHHLDDLGARLDQLRQGLPAGTGPAAGPPAPTHGPRDRPPREGPPLVSRVGSAEWNLLTDEVTWSDELYRITGRDPRHGPMTLDELPSLVHPGDLATLTSMLTGCLVDGRPIDGEFRLLRPGGENATVHMSGEPLLDAEGCTAAMWAVFRDVSALRRSEAEVRDSGEDLHRRRHFEEVAHRVAVELQEAVLPSAHGPLPFTLDTTTPELDVAAHYFPASSTALIGGDWYDALQLPSGACLLSVGDLTGHGVTATSSMAMLLGALRGMALAGIAPARLLAHLNRLMESSAQPALGSALCCRFDPVGRILSWAQAGHPAPLLVRNGAGRALLPPEGMLLGATTAPEYEQAELELRPGDLLVLHTDGLTRDPGRTEGDAERLLALAPDLAAARDAREAVRLIVERFGRVGREDDACVMVARIGD